MFVSVGLQGSKCENMLHSNRGIQNPLSGKTGEFSSILGSSTSIFAMSFNLIPVSLKTNGGSGLFLIEGPYRMFLITKMYDSPFYGQLYCTAASTM